MNLNNIIRIANEIKHLREQADKLEDELRKELIGAKSVFPTDFTRKKESHEEKFSTLPPGTVIPANPIADSWRFWRWESPS